MINGTAFGGNPAAAYRIYENALSAGAGSLLAIRESSRLASEQIADSNAAGRSGPGRVLRMMGNLWTAGADTIGARLSGRVYLGRSRPRWPAR